MSCGQDPDSERPGPVLDLSNPLVKPRLSHPKHILFIFNVLQQLRIADYFSQSAIL
jgi:hypothetical protein